MWIEIPQEKQEKMKELVTPLAGVWIEIFLQGKIRNACKSLPLRECGLKFCLVSPVIKPVEVTPLAGVWIEIEQ